MKTLVSSFFHNITDFVVFSRVCPDRHMHCLKLVWLLSLFITRRIAILIQAKNMAYNLFSKF